MVVRACTRDIDKHGIYIYWGVVGVGVCTLKLTFFIYCFNEFARDGEKLIEMFSNFFVLVSKKYFWIEDEGGVVSDIKYDTGRRVAKGN